MELVGTDDDVRISVDDLVGDDVDRDVGEREEHHHVGEGEERETSL